ncbi:MAG TPA: GNVR domain-containing protein [Candidatus Hydrogenedentes bacterium]|nr:GNVR domain-containing protein [Candidatus Hydrogenedentota bacterium]
MQSDSGMLLSSVRDVLYVIFRHKGKIAVFFVLTAAIVTLVTFLLPVVYESDAQLLIRLGRENLPGDQSVPGTYVNVAQDRTSEVKSEVAILISADLARKVVDEVGEGWILNRTDQTKYRTEDIKIDRPPAPGLLKLVYRQVQDLVKGTLVTLKLMDELTPYEEAVRRVMKDTKVNYEKQTNVVSVTYEAKYGPLAQVVLGKLVQFYLEKHVEVYTPQVSPQFFDDQVKKLEADLAQKEQELDAFRNQYGISSIEAQKENLLAGITKLSGELSDVTADADGVEALVNTLEEIVKSTNRTQELSQTTGMPNYLADKLKERLADFREREAEMSARYPDTHRPLIELREQLKLVEDALSKEPESRTEVTTGLNANREAWEHTWKNEKAQLEARRARQTKLAEEVNKHKEDLAQLASREIELARLTRARDLVEEEYKKYREQLQQAQINAAMDIAKFSNVSVVQPASKPLAPVRPKKLRNVGLGLLLGLFGGIFFAFVREYLDDTLNTTEAVEKRLGVPVLASVSEKEYRACT